MPNNTRTRNSQVTQYILRVTANKKQICTTDCPLEMESIFQSYIGRDQLEIVKEVTTTTYQVLDKDTCV